jgi:hypothetical protein
MTNRDGPYGIDFWDRLNDQILIDTNPDIKIKEQTIVHGFNAVVLMDNLWDWNGVSDEEKRMRLMGVAFHDVGKYKVTWNVYSNLLENGELAVPNFNVGKHPEMKSHPLDGAEILEHALLSLTGDIISYQEVISLSKVHHAMPAYEGEEGYPEGVNYKELNEYQLAMIIIDRFEAMTINKVRDEFGLGQGARQHGGNMTPFEAAQVIKKELGFIKFFKDKEIDVTKRNKIERLLENLKLLDNYPIRKNEKKNGIDQGQYARMVNNTYENYQADMFTQNIYVNQIYDKTKNYHLTSISSDS